MMQLKFCPQGHTPSGWWLSERCPTCGGELGEPGTEEERAVSQKLEKKLAALEKARKVTDRYSVRQVVSSFHDYPDGTGDEDGHEHGGHGHTHEHGAEAGHEHGYEHRH